MIGKGIEKLKFLNCIQYNIIKHKICLRSPCTLWYQREHYQHFICEAMADVSRSNHTVFNACVWLLDFAWFTKKTNFTQTASMKPRPYQIKQLILWKNQVSYLSTSCPKHDKLHKSVEKLFET